MKYYAIRKGKNPGVYSTWHECQKNLGTDKDYVIVDNEEEALQYINGQSMEEIYFDKARNANATLIFVDGSFNIKTQEYAYGCVILTPQNQKIELNGVGNDAEASKIRNVAGELLGAMVALKWAKKNHHTKIIIHYDYEGIEKWYNKKWKANNDAPKKYQEYIKQFSDIDVQFIKIAGHSHNYFNEEADKLAKGALGI